MRGRIGIPLAWIALGIALTLGIGGLRGDVAANAVTTEDLRQATHDFCVRVNDSRRDIGILRHSLTALVAVSITATEGNVRDVFAHELGRLREPQPTLSCADFR